MTSTHTPGATLTKPLPRFYVQWATVCWQVRDRDTHEAVAFHKQQADARIDCRERNAALAKAGGQS